MKISPTQAPMRKHKHEIVVCKILSDLDSVFKSEAVHNLIEFRNVLLPPGEVKRSSINLLIFLGVKNYDKTHQTWPRAQILDAESEEIGCRRKQETKIPCRENMERRKDREISSCKSLHSPQHTDQNRWFDSKLSDVIVKTESALPKFEEKHWKPIEVNMKFIQEKKPPTRTETKPTNFLL